MSVTVHLPSILNFGRARRVRVEAATLAGALDALDVSIPGIREQLMEGARLRPLILISVDGRVISPYNPDLSLDDGASVDIFQNIAGG